MSDPTSSALDALISRFEQHWNGQWPTIDQDPDWPSPCLLAELPSGEMSWRPMRRSKAIDYSGVEEALEVRLHPSIKTFYSRYFSETLTARHPQLNLELVQVWNEEDTERLLENLIGHLLMQRRLKQIETMFIASTDDDMAVVSVINSTGEVVLETLGKGITQQLADSLAEFIELLQPTTP